MNIVGKIIGIKYKECDCSDEYWEEIVVRDDDHYDNRTVLYFHCSYCGTDFRVEDFYTGEEVFYNDENAESFNPTELFDAE